LEIIDSVLSVQEELVISCYGVSIDESSQLIAVSTVGNITGDGTMSTGGVNCSGGGYGGNGGGASDTNGGNAYGSVVDPSDIGSLGCSGSSGGGGYAGGIISIEVLSQALIAGTINTNGQDAQDGGGGSGGSVHIGCSKLNGYGSITANGGNGTDGGSGGGGGGGLYCLFFNLPNKIIIFVFIFILKRWWKNITHFSAQVVSRNIDCNRWDWCQ
jgi:hypothetical protein